MSSSQDHECILLVSALQEELDSLWENAGFDWSEPCEDGDGIWYRRCIYDGYELVSACACEVGLTSTSILVTNLVLSWHPIFVVMLGICGGRKDAELDIGDVVFSTGAIQYQKGKFVRGVLEIKSGELEAKDIVVELARTYTKSHTAGAIADLFPGARPPRASQLAIGVYACADLVVKDQDKFDEAIRERSDIRSLDMESYALMRVAERLRVPFGGLVSKAVSDHADKNKSRKFRGFAKFMSKQATVNFLVDEFIPWHKKRDIGNEYYSPSATIQIDVCGQEPRVLLLCGNESALNSIEQTGTAWRGIKRFDKPFGGMISALVNGLRVFAVSTPTGFVDSAMVTTALIRSIRPTIAVMFGPCGGFSDRTQLGDLIVANRAFHFQFGGFRDGEIQRELRVVDINDRIRGLLFAISSSDFDQFMQSAHESFCGSAGVSKPIETPRWHIQPIASSDLFIKDPDKLGEAINKDRKVAAVDMEGYAFMRAAQFSGIPLGGMIVRTVADHADDDTSGVRYVDYANHTSTHFVTKLLMGQLSKLIKDVTQ